MLSFVAVFFLLASAEAETVTWFSAPNFRGTSDLIISCVLTLTICVWSALHLNVPTEGSTLTERNLRRVRWILLGIFAPEFVVATALAQYLTTRWLRKEISLDVTYRKALDTATPQEQLEEWGTYQCYFAIMGGITIQTGSCFEGSPRLTLTPEGVRLLSFLGRLPQISESQVKDKSKADGLGKTLVCLQAIWMIVQTIARLNAHLPVTLLEINTIGHVLCALVLYLLWWSKPHEVKDSILIPHEDWMDPFLAHMWMCSPISSNKDDEITEMRCMAYTPPSQRGVIAPTITIEEDNTAPEIDPTKTLVKSHDMHSSHATHFSVGSAGARNPQKFIGPLPDFRVGLNEYDAVLYDGNNVTYMITDSEQKTAPEHEVFFSLQGPEHGLQHTRKYCRRGLSDCNTHAPLSEHAIARWLLANKLVDDLWNMCEKRPSYMMFFFTTSTLSIFVGETAYIDTHVANFLGISYLGSVNIHHDRLKSVLFFTAGLYGALHLSAWNEFFPSRIERYLWLASSFAISCSGILLWAYFTIKAQFISVDRLGNDIGSSKKIGIVAASIFGPIFLLSRLYLVTEGFISLRLVEVGVYATPEWTDYLPHL